MSNIQTLYNWSIYKITNPKGRVYIGKTRALANRIRQYKNFAHKDGQPKVYRSLVKYGFDNHLFQVIDSFVSDVTYAAGKEIFWIRSFMSNSMKYPECNGMNLTDGGEGGLGYRCTEERKRQVSEQMKGNKYGIGRVQTESEKLKRALSNRGKKRSGEAAINIKDSNIKLRGKPIIQYNLEGNIVAEYRTMNDAAKCIGVTRRTIELIMNGTTKRPNHARRNFIFKYKYQ